MELSRVLTLDATFDATRRHQTIDNFGASQAWWVDVVGRLFPPEAMDQIADLLFDRRKGIGLSCTRFNVGAGSQWCDKEYIENWFMRSECFRRGPADPYDWNVHAGQQRLLRLARERGVERTIAFSNSPPGWLTANGHARGDETTGSTNMGPGNEGPFARFLADVLLHFEEHELGFDYVSPVNEPQVPWDTAKQEGCRYSNEDLVRTVLALRRELDRRELATDILFNETNSLWDLIDLDILEPVVGSYVTRDEWMKHAFHHDAKYVEGIKDVFGIPAVRAAIAPVIACHSYETDGPAALIPARHMTQATRNRHGGFDMWMTEYCVLGPDGPGRDLGMDTAIRVARVIHHDLVGLDAAAWQWWLAVSGSDYKDGLLYLDLDGRRVLDSKLLWALGHWSRFLRPGSTRVDLSVASAPDGLLASGYEGADGKPVVVLINGGNDAVSISIDGVSVRTWKAYRTDSNSNLEPTDLPRISRGAGMKRNPGKAVIGPRSIFTLVGER